jgi:tetratricopeptide (TPR) repeat protein
MSGQRGIVEQHSVRAPRRFVFPIVLLAGTAAIAACGLVLCYWSLSDHYLAAERPGEWIVYPMSIELIGHPAAEQRALFRRSFAIRELPREATLRIRACERFEATINGRTVDVESPPGKNWKQSTQIDVLRYLQRGDNNISITVFCFNGPPALWLSLIAGDCSLATDNQWQVSRSGAAERSAAPALAPIESVRGDVIADSERTVESLKACRWTLVLYVGLSFLIVAVFVWGQKWLASRFPIRLPWYAVALTVIVVLWISLFFNNSLSLNRYLGFDFGAHVEYIDYLQKRRAVPLADEGWELFQPPLYYVLSALCLTSCGLSVGDEGAALLLRFMSLLVFVVRIVLIYACLRLVFPKQARPQQVGLLLAAFIPVHLYMFQFVANEPMMSVFGAGAVYIALRMLGDREYRLGVPVALGLCLGAALLTKVTALLPAVVIIGALAAQLVAERRYSPLTWLRTIAAPLLVCLAVSGWYYVCVWRHFGTPFVTNMSVESGFAHWSPPGYSDASYFRRFGRTLDNPFFGGAYSFADGIYSTLWGDGTWGGAPMLETRPPWNYHLMSAGYLLAIIPTVLVLVGAVVALVRFFRRPSAEWLLLIGLAVSLVGAEACFYLEHPISIAVQARFGLIEMVVLCALAGLGFDFLARGRRAIGFLLGVGLCTWALTSYSSFWIVKSAPDTLAWRGCVFLTRGDIDLSIAEFEQALRLDPNNASAHIGLSAALSGRGNIDAAIAHCEQALKTRPDFVAGHFQVANALAQRGRLEAAIGHYRKAIEIEPDNAKAHYNLATILNQHGEPGAAIAEYRKALEIEPDDSAAQYDFALLLESSGQLDDALVHYRKALALAEAQKQTALAATIRDRIERGEKLAPRHDGDRETPH